MSLKIRNTREYVDPDKFRLKALIYGASGVGKTTWVGTCPTERTGIAACDTGVGSGLLSIASKGFDHIVPENLSELEQFCSGKVFPDKSILVVDPVSAIARGMIKDVAVAMPRRGGNSEKRALGIPELDDYGTIGGLTAKYLNLLFASNPDKHFIVTATERWDRPNENDPPGTESLFGPNLAGQMFNEAPALFDFVLRLRVRSVLKNPLDAKSRYLQRYFETDKRPGVIAKCRSNGGVGKPMLDSEEVFDVDKGLGTFEYLLNKIVEGYRNDGAANQKA